MCIPTHNYQVSCPHRLKAFEAALDYITGHDDVWLTTGREIAEHFLTQGYADMQQAMQRTELHHGA
jgi:hypothetical protein